ncbi:MAG: cysteine synthase A [Planctomycetaceae bacterium]|nr:MAG: cysteine synthase A [Planctomycetaceae bacterium]
MADQVGRTPLVTLRRVIPEHHARVLVKCEFLNPLASVKDRIGVAMISDAERQGVLYPGCQIIEPTSGNTGIALAWVAAAKGYPLTLTMPDSMSQERRALLRALGANLILTPSAEGISGAMRAAHAIYAETENAWMPRQFDNPANPAIHEATTGPEIAAAVGGTIDILVAAVGTGGTLTGVSRYLRTLNPDLVTVAVEPAESPVIQGGLPGRHPIQGIGAGFVPQNLDTKLVSEVLSVTGEEAFAWSRRLATEEGLLVGISSGANLAAAARLARRRENRGKTIVTVACSSGERYLSTPLFQLIGYSGTADHSAQI